MSDQTSKTRYVWGAKKIAEAAGVTPRQAFYMLEAGLLPGKKVGDRWVSDLARLHDALSGNENEEIEN